MIIKFSIFTCFPIFEFIMGPILVTNFRVMALRQYLGDDIMTYKGYIFCAYSPAAGVNTSN